MIINPKYSIILFYPEIYLENFKYIEKCLLDGVIVYAFLRGTFQEELELNEYENKLFEVAKKNQLLVIYENIDGLSETEQIIAIDGNVVNQQMYRSICEKNSEFNNKQYEIITAPTNTNIIVSSGAGTGKTTTMIKRLIFLRNTDEDFSFDKAALITFTNKASREMREKLIELLEAYFKVTKKSKYLDMMDESSRCNISTIHIFSKNMINEYGKNISINKSIKVTSFKYKRKKAITEAINRIYKSDRELYDIIKYYPLYEVEEKVLAMWAVLDNFSIDINSPNYNLDFGEDENNFSKLIKKILVYAQDVLNLDKEYELEVSDLMKKLSNKNLIKNMKNNYKLIMVDEFQDSDNVQIEFIANFCKETCCDLLVVGDEKQSIYRFRGAEHTAFYKLKELIKESTKIMKCFSMTRNYRTDSKLLENINNIFINIDKRVVNFNYKEEDYIYSLNDKEIDKKIQYIRYEDKKELANFYNELLNNKKEDDKVAVLLRSNNDIKNFKYFCDIYKVPCRVDISGGFYRHEAVRDFYIMIKALIEENDNRILYSFIETPYVNKCIDKSKIIEGQYNDTNTYLHYILKENGWEDIRSLRERASPLRLIDKIIKELNPVKNYHKKALIDFKDITNGEKAAYRKTLDYKVNLQHLLFLIKDNFAEDVTSIFIIENFLRLKIATDNTVDVRTLDKKYENGFIQCLTVHKAKGLEYDTVVLPKLTNPFSTIKDINLILRDDKSKIKMGYYIKIDEDEYKNNYYGQFFKDELEEIIGEETRLLYVAMTRCKKQLYLNMQGLSATESINNWKSLIGGGMKYVYSTNPR